MPALNNCRVLRTGLFLFPVTNVFQNTNSLCLKVVPNSLYLAQGPYLKYWWFCTTVKAEGKDRGDHCKLLWLLLCAMPCLQKSHLQTLRHLTEFGSKVIISQERKKQMQGRGALPEATTRRLEQKPDPLLSGAPGPQNPTIQTGRTQKRNPPRRGNVFPQKQFPPICIPATNSLPVSDATIQKWPVAFWLERNCSHSSMTCL